MQNAAQDVLARPRLTIDLAAAAANYALVKERAHGAEAGATIKADAYGLGAEPLARAFSAAGCTTFFVANAEEGARARAALGATPAIYVYNGILEGEAETFLAHDLRPILNDAWQVELWARARAQSAHARAALHVDTGINRLGMATALARDILESRDALNDTGVDLVISHLACADEPAAPHNARQRDAFAALADDLRARHDGLRFSLANSAGVWLGADYAFDLVRPGYALYGGHASPLSPALQTVVTLEAPILQLRELSKGDAVGYGASWRAEHDVLAATVALGYADGFLRAGGGRGYGVLNGVKCPILGRISMDLATLDISQARSAASPGALIEFLGANADLDKAGAAAGTIGYELLTGLGPRCARQYLTASS